MDDSVRAVPTKDGSFSLYAERFGQAYHNPNGAYSESEYVFFAASGLERASSFADCTIFEIGFGTALNARMACELANKNEHHIDFWSVEKHLISRELFAELQVPQLSVSRFNESFAQVFSSLGTGWNHLHLNTFFTLHLFVGDFLNLTSEDLPQVDFVFHDGFSPQANEELWSVDVFEFLKEVMSPKAVLSTYCAASAARANMCQAGLCVGKKPGCLGKREMTLATKREDILVENGAKPVNCARLKERFCRGDFN